MMNQSSQLHQRLTNDVNSHQRRQYTINNLLPATRARAVGETIPASKDNIGQAQSVQNVLRSAVESLKSLVNEEFECPICLETCSDTRTNPECLHRFCGDCINERIRRCNKECPSCRVHIPTKRTLREDKKFDHIVSKTSVICYTLYSYV